MLNNINNDNIISKSVIYQKLMSESLLNECFAKTINYHGIHSKFCLDTPEILENELKIEERKKDIEKFSQVLLSRKDNEEDNKKIIELLNNDAIIKSLTENENLLRDLDLL